MIQKYIPGSIVMTIPAFNLAWIINSTDRNILRTTYCPPRSEYDDSCKSIKFLSRPLAGR